MIPLTTPRPPAMLGDDPLAAWLLERTDPQLVAPARPRVVTERCAGNLSLLAAWDALNELSLLYSQLGRNDFSAREISLVPAARGISRGRLPSYIRQLCELGLVEVVGHSAIPGLYDRQTGGQMQKAHYHIDYDRLYVESARLTADLLRRLGLPGPQLRYGAPGQSRRSASPAQQAELSLDLDPAAAPAPPPSSAHVQPHEAREIWDLAPAGVGVQPPEVVGRAAPSPAGGGLASASFVAEDAGQHPGKPAAASPTPRGAGAAAGGSGLHSIGACAHHPRVLAQAARSSAGDGPSTRRGEAPAPTDVVGRGDGWDLWRHGGTEGARDERALLSRAEAVALVQQVVHDALAPVLELTASLKAQATPQGAWPEPETERDAPDEAAPPAPEGEPEISEGPMRAWSLFTGQLATERVRAQLGELTRRYELASGGHAGYWLARVIAQASIEDKPVTPAYLDGIMRRLKRDGWTSEVLAQRRSDAQPAAALGRAPRAQEPAGRAAEPLLPADLLEAPAVQDYLADAPAGIVVPQEWAAAIKKTVANRELWKSVRDNWRRRPRSDYANVEGMLDRYVREERALRRHRAEQAAAGPAAAPQGERDRLYAAVGRRLDQAYRCHPHRQEILGFLGRAVYERGLSEDELLAEVLARFGPEPAA